MSNVSAIVRALGGQRLVPARSVSELAALVRAGLPFAALTAVASGYRLAAGDAASILRIPARTLARRRKDARLSAEESDRLVRLGRIAALAEDVLGSRERAASWLHADNRALGATAPLSALDTDPGAEQVEAVLLRLAHGVVG